MNGDLFLIFRDIVVTGFQMWCLELLASNEEKNGNKFVRKIFFRCW